MSEAVDTLDNKGKGEKESVGEFIQHTREELDKTSFPSSDDVKNTTIIVIVNVIFFAIFLFFDRPILGLYHWSSNLAG